MKVPFEWLKEFVIIDVDPQELAKRLTLRGLEVEAIETLSPIFDGVIVSTIKSIEKHPNADNLSICSVDTGKEDLTVVCGARNISEGNRVPLATVGSRLGDFVIEQKKLRGVESYGMLCSERELGLSDDHSGIFILPDDLSTGTNLKEIDWIFDSILDINTAPNRGDCMSMLGIAREVASILNQKAKLPHFEIGEEKESTAENISLDIKNTDACPRYVLRMIRDISIKNSPFWMKHRLRKCGMRPINTVVDVTNYVMLEIGQPLHAFDYDRINSKRIEVRLADKEETFRTLDSMDRKLEGGDILICDGSGPVAIAGIMGGENSEITENTCNMALESAYFNPIYVRKTARRLGIKSEASLRFEKGIDLDNVGFAADRAVHLMQQVSGGHILHGKREIFKKQRPKTVFLTYSNVNGLLGTHIRQKEINQALRSIDLHITDEGEKGFAVSVPNFRHDINEPADIIEEISRIHGYEHIPATQPVTTVQSQKLTKQDILTDKVRSYCVAAGFYEIINFAFANVRDIQNLHIPPTDSRSNMVEIMNPISREFSHMRTLMTPGVLKSLAYNLNRGTKNLKFFERGKVFTANQGKHPVEKVSLCFAITGKEREFYWREKFTDFDFFDIKGIIEGFMDSIGASLSFNTTNEPFLHPVRSADIFVNTVKTGWVGQIADDVLKAFDIEQPVYCAEVELDPSIHAGNFAVQYKPIPRYPQVTRDFSFYVSDTVPIGSLADNIKSLSPLITSVGIFDMFRKEMRSVAIRVTFQSFEETLKDETVNILQEAIIKTLSSTEGISLRT